MNCYRQRQRRLQNTEPTARVPPARQGNRPVSLTSRVLLGKLHQTANLLADLLIGPQDVIALLLPDLLETHLLFWGGQAAGVVCPIHPCAPLDQVVALVRMVGAKVLVAPGPEVSQDLWRKAELLAMRGGEHQGGPPSPGTRERAGCHLCLRCPAGGLPGVPP